MRKRRERGEGIGRQMNELGVLSSAVLLARGRREKGEKKGNEKEKEKEKKENGLIRKGEEIFYLKRKLM